jgi:hypothetical protein
MRLHRRAESKEIVVKGADRMITVPYRRQCAVCQQPIAVCEINDGMGTTTFCPTCNKVPGASAFVNQLPTLSYLEHAETCTLCNFPDVLCSEGHERLADYPGAWSGEEIV